MAKEKSTTELRAEKDQLVARGKEITAAAKGESRMLNDGENKELSDIQVRLSEINIEIAAKEAENRGNGNPHEPSKPFSLRKALLELVDGGQYSDETRAIIEAGRTALERNGIAASRGNGLAIPVEGRASFTATGTVGTGKDIIETSFLDILTPLRDRLVLAKAGATTLTGLVGNIDIPAYSGSTADWEGENAAAKDGGGTFSHKTMKPKRLTTKLMISRQLLIQDSLGVEQMLRSDLIAAIASKLEATILGNHATAATKPDGIFTGFADSAVALDWDNIVDLETAADLGNALTGNVGYIMHTSLRGKAKKTVKKAAGALGFILDPDGTLNGYQALRTNAIANVAASGEDPASYGIAFGDWSQLLIGQWGALDLIVDPYTKADEAFVRIIVNSYWDAQVKRDGVISKKLMF